MTLHIISERQESARLFFDPWNCEWEHDASVLMDYEEMEIGRVDGHYVTIKRPRGKEKMALSILVPFRQDSPD